ncbi:unnamed protein product [Microthlaspi erraticum]|uniref:Uncharacterized protein n=1 Tax=Microthlaspi erraticum TaxID=1685480 RepID=A0A6D2IGB4_9BRAS|nr:unnamed protein product [Microthlaspi erraticum]
MASYMMVADLHSMVTNTTLVVKVLKKWVDAGPRGWNHVVDGGGISRFEFDPRFPIAQELKENIGNHHHTVNTAKHTSSLIIAIALYEEQDLHYNTR